MNKMKIIVVEGPDCCGKTTFIKALKCHYQEKRKKVEVQPSFNGRTLSALQQYGLFLECIQEAKENSLDVLILDRCFISDYVYGTTKSDRRNLTEYTTIELIKASIEMCERASDKLTYIFCITEKCKEIIEKRGDDYITKSNLNILINLYSDIYYKLRSWYDIEDRNCIKLYDFDKNDIILI